MARSPLFWIAVGALGYYGYARYRGVLAGPVWAPLPAAANRG